MAYDCGMLDPHRLRVFRSVVASGSVQAAADNLGLTSSAVSQHLVGPAAGDRADPVPAGRARHRAHRGRAGARRPDRRGDEPVEPARPGRRRPARRPFGAAVDRLLLLRRRRLDAVARQAADRRVPRPRARAGAQRGGAAGAAASTSTSSSTRRTARCRAATGAPSSPRTSSSRSCRAATPSPTPASIALADLRGETWVSNDYPRAYGHRLVVAACSAAGFRPRFSVQAQDHYTAIGFVGAGHRGLGAARASRRAACRRRSCGSASRHRRRCATWPPSCATSGRPNPPAERAVALLTELIAHPSSASRGGRAPGWDQ